jgi:hypothetical protein
MIWIVFAVVALWMVGRRRSSPRTAPRLVRHVSNQEWTVRWVLMILLILLLVGSVSSLFR